MNKRFFSKTIFPIIISIYVSSINVFAVGQTATATSVKANTSFSPYFILEKRAGFDFQYEWVWI